MTTEGQSDSDTANVRQKKSKLQSIIWATVVIVSIAGGFATPLLVAKVTTLKRGTEPSESPKSSIANAHDEMVYVDFEEVVGVLAQSKFRRYLRIVMTLEVAKSDKPEVESQIAARLPVLRNQALLYIAEITQNDLTAGEQGYNQLRQNFLKMFNDILFDDGVQRVQDVLFRELMVQ